MRSHFLADTLFVMKTTEIIQNYYNAFNQQDRSKILSFLSENIIHDVNQGGREVGKKAFNHFLDKMDGAYLETLNDMTIMVDATGTRAAAEFVVHGTYLKTDEGLPEAHGQKYVLPAGAFLEVDPAQGVITRISMHYNLPLWIQLVSQN